MARCSRCGCRDRSALRMVRKRSPKFLVSTVVPAVASGVVGTLNLARQPNSRVGRQCCAFCMCGALTAAAGPLHWLRAAVRLQYRDRAHRAERVAELGGGHALCILCRPRPYPLLEPRCVPGISAPARSSVAMAALCAQPIAFGGSGYWLPVVILATNASLPPAFV